ncbi:long-chain-fatty-acid--CoA ligase [Pueribacillus theae]|nr:long-chain fatty acid--CoA ligase [Pueribacillus theae]
MEEKWMEFWPKGMPRTIDYPVIPVGEIIKGSAHRFGNKTAIIYKEKEFSYQSLYEEALKFANALKDNGFKKGDVIAIHMPNCPQYAIAYYGILLSGATFSPANPLLPPKDLAYQLNDCGAKAVVTWEQTAPNIKKVLLDTKLELAIVTGDTELTNEGIMDVSDEDGNWVSFNKFKEQGEAKELTIDINPKEDLAHIAYTGGTTGPSKGVLISHYNVVVNVIQFNSWRSGHLPNATENGLMMEVPDSVNIDEYPSKMGKDRLINLTPWFHAMGTVGYMNNPFLSGSTLILHQRFDPGLYLQDAEKYKVTGMGGAPPIYVALVRHPDFHKRDLSSITTISSGAAPLPVELIHLLKNRFPGVIVNEGYGLTEVTMGASSNPSFKSGVRKDGSVGIPVFDTEVKICPLDGSFEALPPREEGEICVKGPQVMRGYYNKPEETAAVLKDGWLRTGDIGYMDEDGFIFIVDRKKDMLIYKGYNVYPRELEELLFKHPSVANAAVVGKPDMEVGEIPKAYVVVKSGEQITEQQLMDHVNEQVIPYKKIRELEFVDEIPVSAAGKVLKRVLRDREKSRSKA